MAFSKKPAICAYGEVLNDFHDMQHKIDKEGGLSGKRMIAAGADFIARAKTLGLSDAEVAKVLWVMVLDFVVYQQSQAAPIDTIPEPKSKTIH